MPFYGSVVGDMGTGRAPSLPVEKPYVDQGPPLSAYHPAAPAAIEKPAPKASFLASTSPIANMPWWQVCLGGIGVLAVGVGVYSLVRGR